MSPDFLAAKRWDNIDFNVNILASCMDRKLCLLMISLQSARNNVALFPHVRCTDGSQRRAYYLIWDVWKTGWQTLCLYQEQSKSLSSHFSFSCPALCQQDLDQCWPNESICKAKILTVYCSRKRRAQGHFREAASLLCFPFFSFYPDLPYLLCGVCMLSPCLRGSSPGALASPTVQTHAR